MIKFFTKISILLTLISCVAAQELIVNKEQSEVRILVYKQGLLSAFGHNHVVTSHDLTGYVQANAAHPQQSEFAITMPVNSLIMDNEQARQEEGEAFKSELSAAAKQKTKEHMLGDKILKADASLEVRVTGTLASWNSSKAEIKTDITIRGITRSMLLPVTLSHNNSSLTAVGQLSIKLSDFAITPFKSFRGIFALQDTLLIKYKIVADSH